MERPHVTLSFAQSVDGRLATITGDSQWISGRAGLKAAHRLRRDSDAILVGSGTVLEDNPLLTCRIRSCRGRTPLRIVLDRRLRIPLDCRLVQTSGEVPLLIYTSEGADRQKRALLENAGVEIIELEHGPPEKMEASPTDRLPVEGIEEKETRTRLLALVLQNLARRGVKNLMVEGGAEIVTTFLRSGFADKVMIAIAPIFIGTGKEAVGDLETGLLSEALRPSKSRPRRYRDEILWEMEFKPAGEENE
ncbi:MAG: RibD family protein [Spirochaetales bacterium]|nr:RibD family protein [Spirochaetales bacterium]MCF7938047.1 RibD family protein [Spirochaetales bacterium]